eukprot:3022041-Pyramimonas_sp.AAC.1
MPHVKGKCEIDVRVGNKIVVKNVGEKDVSMTKGSLLMGFGKVTYKYIKDGDKPLEEKHVTFDLSSSEDSRVEEVRA